MGLLRIISMMMGHFVLDVSYNILRKLGDVFSVGRCSDIIPDTLRERRRGLPDLRCDICDRLLGYYPESLFYEAYCPECHSQREERKKVWIIKHPEEAYMMAQIVLDSFGSETDGLVIKD